MRCSVTIAHLHSVFILVENFHKQVRIVIVPGNSSDDIESSVWFSWVRDRLIVKHGIKEVIMRNMPNPCAAREAEWLPFLRDTLGCDERTIIIGYSSGSAAAMRFAEDNPVAGLALVSAYSSDLGNATERASGYFNRPWLWNRIRRNSKFIIQFGSRDDPFLLWSEQQVVAKSLGATTKWFDDRGHFMDKEFPELVEVLEEHLQASSGF